MIDIPTWLGCYKTKHYFLCRESIHFAAGLLIGGASQFSKFGDFNIEVIVKTLLGCSLLAFIVIKEIFEDRVSQSRFKTFCDCIAWVSGYVLVAIW